MKSKNNMQRVAQTLGLFLLGFFIMARCGDHVPIDKLKDAKKAIMKAENIGANNHAPKRLTKARSTLHQAHKLVSDEEKDKAGEKADEAKRLAELAEIVTKAHRSQNAAHEKISQADKSIKNAELANAEMYAPEKLKEAHGYQGKAQKNKEKGKELMAKAQKDESGDKKEYQNIINTAQDTKSLAQKADDAAQEAYNICAQEVPKIRQSINDVEKTISQTKAIGGDQYAKEKLDTAQSELANAKSLTSEMKLKKALKHLETAKTNADEALLISQRKRADKQIEDAEKLLTQADESIAKEKKIDEYNGAKESLNTAKKARSEKRYNDAFSHADESLRLSRKVLGAEPEVMAERRRQQQEQQEQQEQQKIETLQQKKERLEQTIKYWNAMEDAKKHKIRWHENYRETLWRISQHYYNDARLWPRIYRINKDKIKDPDLIYPNQEIVVPPKEVEIPKKIISKEEAQKQLKEVNKQLANQ